MSIHKATINDAKQIQTLILRAADPENNTDFDQEGIVYFNTLNQLSTIKNRILSEKYLCLCFVQNEKIAGILTMHNNEAISQLFVDPAFRGLKVSKQLWQAAKKICAKHSNKGNYRVRSSTAAVPVYQSFGFQMQGEFQKKNGVGFYSMALECENDCQ